MKIKLACNQTIQTQSTTFLPSLSRSWKYAVPVKYSNSSRPDAAARVLSLEDRLRSGGGSQRAARHGVGVVTELSVTGSARKQA